MKLVRHISAIAAGIIATAGLVRGQDLIGRRSIAPAPVVSIQSQASADLVFLRAGYDVGLRQGMVCQVKRAGSSIGEILIVDLRRQHSAALILGLTPGQLIQPGDQAFVKSINT